MLFFKNLTQFIVLFLVLLFFTACGGSEEETKPLTNESLHDSNSSNLQNQDALNIEETTNQNSEIPTNIKEPTTENPVDNLSDKKDENIQEALEPESETSIDSEETVTENLSEDEISSNVEENTSNNALNQEENTTNDTSDVETETSLNNETLVDENTSKDIISEEDETVSNREDNGTTVSHLQEATISGIVIDGEISGATVFLDLNRNGALESKEPSTTTNENGKYILKVTQEHVSHKNYKNKKAPIVIFGGVDIRTGKAFDDYLTAIVEDENETNVTPLTTLISEALGEELDADVNETISSIDTRLDEIKKNLADLLEIKRELLTKNPIELAEDGNVTLIDTSLQIHKVAKNMKKAMRSDVRQLKRSILKSYRAVAKSLKRLKKSSVKEGDTALVRAIDEALEDNEIFDSQFKEAVKEKSKELSQEIKAFWSRNRVPLSDDDITTVLNGVEIVIVDANRSVVNDSVAPKIIRLGRENINIMQGEEYIDRGAIARDNKDGDITVQMVTFNPVNTSKTGEYIITYNVEDSAGNVAQEVKRFVTVLSGEFVDTNVSETGSSNENNVSTETISLGDNNTTFDNNTSDEGNSSNENSVSNETNSSNENDVTNETNSLTGNDTSETGSLNETTPSTENNTLNENNNTVETNPSSEDNTSNQTTPSNENNTSSENNISSEAVPSVENNTSTENNSTVETNPSSEHNTSNQITPSNENNTSSENNISSETVPSVENNTSSENNNTVETNPSSEHNTSNQTTPSNESNTSSENNVSSETVPSVENNTSSENNNTVETNPSSEDNTSNQTTPSNESNTSSENNVSDETTPPSEHNTSIENNTSSENNNSINLVSSIPEKSIPLLEYLQKMDFGSTGDNLWQEPSSDKSFNVAKIVEKILARQYLEAHQLALEFDSEVVKVIDNAKEYYVLHVDVEYLNNDEYKALGGTYVFNPKGVNSAIQVPHPLFDSNTHLQGIETYLALGSRYLLISGTHRKSSTTDSSCQSDYKESDASHNESHLFHQVHKVLSSFNTKTLFIELHGFGSSTRETLWSQCDENNNSLLLNISEGVGDRGSLDENTFMHLFHKEITNSSSIRSCIYSPSQNNSHSDIYTSSLGGTTNVSGRFTNGVSSDVCDTPATNPSHRFIHLEQSYEVRRDHRETIISALKTAERGLVDIAHKYGKATQGTDSSYYYYDPASYAIDNNDSTYNHTRGGAQGKNWLQIELPSPTEISKVVIQNRGSSAYRLSNAKVYILDEPYSGEVDENDSVKTLLGINSEQVISFTTPQSGTYLLIKGEETANDNRHLHLKKVEVYGVLPPKPIFQTLPNEIFVSESADNGTVVTNILAHDFQGDKLTYNIHGDVPFSIDENGNILVNGVLDYGVYTFDVEVSDGVYSETTTVSINANSEGVAENIAHKFGVAIQSSDSSYSYYLQPQNAIDNNLSTMNMTADSGWLQVALPKGSKLSKVVVRNRSDSWTGRLNRTKVYVGTQDFNGTLIESDYIGTLTSSTSPQIFTFETLKDGDYILLKEDDDNLHVLEVEAYGVTPPSPVFAKERYMLGLKPYTAVGTVVGELKAVDYQSDVLTYSIVGDVPFSIDQNGTLRLTQEIAHNSVQSFDFSVQVSDGENNTTSDVTVKLLNGNGVKQERWYGISGTAVSDLLTHEHYQDEPDETTLVNDLDMNENSSSNFGQKMTTTLKVEESGVYIFAIVGDDGTELRLDGQEIAQRSSWTSYQNWSSAGKSKELHLGAGSIYQLEALLKESGGSEHISVAWKKADESEFTLIPENQLFLGLLDSESVKPVIQEGKREYLIEGTTLIGTHVAQIVANDFQGDNLIYTIKEEVPFSIDNEGNITVSGTFEQLTYTFTVEVSDGVNVVTTQLSINVTSDTAVEDVLASGDVLNTPITENELLDAALNEIEASKTYMLEAKVKIFNLESNGTVKHDSTSLTNITWNPTHDASLFSSTFGKNIPILYTNAVSRENYTVYEKEIGIIGNVPSNYMVLGSNPMRNSYRDSSSANIDMHQVLENSLAWLTGRDDLKTAPFNVVIAHVNQGYYFPDEVAIRAWLDEHFAGQVNYNSENGCDDEMLVSCVESRPDLLIISQVQNSNTNPKTVVNAVKSAMEKGVPLLYMHHDGGKTDLGESLFSLLDVNYVWDNYWKMLSLEGFNPSNHIGLLSEEILNVKNLLTHLKKSDYDFDWSQCQDSSGNMSSENDKCSDIPDLKTTFQEGASSIKSMIDYLDSRLKGIFSTESYRLQKLLVLLADKYRQKVVYPMDKVSTDDTEFMKSFYADHAVYNNRKINPVQKDMGNFSRSDFSHITPHSKTVTLSSKKNFRSTGVYALPGQTMKVTRHDNSDVVTKVFINSLRSGATHQYEVNGYKRPKYLQTPKFEIETGESIELTSPYGGPVHLSFDTNDLNVSFTFENIGEHAYWASSADNDTFTQKLDAGEFDWAEIVTSGFEVHSKLDKMRESVSDEKWGSAEVLAAATKQYMSNYPHVLAGFKGPGIDVVSEIHDFATENNLTINNLDLVKHMNADQAACGYGCSGNPYDAYWAFSPIGHGDVHELGHGLEKSRFQFEGFERHAITNPYSYYTKSKYNAVTGGDPSCQNLPFREVYEKLQESVQESNATTYLKNNLWESSRWSQQFMVTLQAMMHAQKMGKLQNGWHLLARLHILEREIGRADDDWENRKASIGFSSYTLSEFRTMRKNDWLLISLSFAAGLDYRDYLSMMGIEYNAKASAQVESFGYEKVPQTFFISTPNGYCKSDDIYGAFLDKDSLSIDGNVSAWVDDSEYVPAVENEH